MKNKIFTAILLFASFSFAQYGEQDESPVQANVTTENTVQEAFQESANATTYTTETYTRPKVDESDPYYHTHRGFYFSTSIGFAYTYLRHSNAYREKEKSHKFTGLMLPYEETRLGGSISNLVSIYSLIGVGAGTGSIEYEYKKNGDNYEDYKIDASGLRFALGLGLDFYPIQDKENPVYGLFVGLSSGILLDATFHKSNSSNDDNFINIFYRLEVGRDWWFSKRWCFGVALNYTFGTMSLGDDDDVLDNYRNHSFGLSVRIAH